MVLNTKWPYYAFEVLDALHPKKDGHGVLRLKQNEPHRVERMIFRIVQDLQPSTMLEIGNVNGIETQYMTHACPKATCYSIAYAAESKGEQSLKAALSNVDSLDFVLFNAPAERQKRMNEFKYCLQKMNEGSLFVIKHIHQTPEQAFTWKMMRSHPEVRASIDLYSLGILFFKNDLPKCKLRIKT